MAQLAREGLVATLALGNIKGVDILVTNEDFNKLFNVEVKASVTKPGRAKLFDDGYFFSRTMSKKCGDITDDNLVYCFVELLSLNELPQLQAAV